MPDPADRAPEGVALLLGRLEGRLVALEVRLDRHEDAYTTRLSVIEAKLDEINKSIAEGLGGVRAFHWVGGALLAVGGFIANHFWQRNG